MLLTAGAVLLIGAVTVTGAWTGAVRRWKRSMVTSDDPRYVANLATLSAGSVRRRFDPYVDIDWDAPEFAVTPNDPRWVLPESDPFGQHPWYRAQPQERQIAIGMWRQANIAKVAMHFENILIRGMMAYTFFVPNGSPEYRYCMHESIEECNHTLMFQELVNRIGADVSGMPRWLRWLAALAPMVAAPLPNTFFFGVLAGEVPFDHLQKQVLREDAPTHPVLHKIIAIHVAEEARHISFAHEYLSARVPRLLWVSRLLLSLYVPLVMLVLGRAMLLPPRSFFREFHIPRSVRRQLFSGTPESHKSARDMFADIRLLCDDVGLMNPAARLMWRACRISGPVSRYRSEPQRAYQ